MPVLLEQVLAGLAIRADGCYLDCTFGRGGHSAALLERLGESGRVIAIDRDASAAAAAKALESDPRFTFQVARFSQLATVVRAAGMAGRLAGVLFDLGVSSPQLDAAERGFSFLRDGPLDMRMSPCGQTAADWLARTAERDIESCLREFGEEKFARRIARAIVAARVQQPLHTTSQLVAVLDRAIPHKPRDIHFATRTFQAIRIAINEELDELRAALPQALAMLAPGGRLVVISFHSLEDRIVKRLLRNEARGGEPAPWPLPTVATPRLRLIGRAVRPDDEETRRNRRARSATLRIAEKLP
ncbi:MAG: 16S rRNA (cytosine(1402)-N(4))-methyltransferase RsmH [Gammaproteobacteria bacterium]|nr:16S rRNA (cytosine(1402)-N(4))-methyltransferase RsmH [Gammaproteobacteria bacterium]